MDTHSVASTFRKKRDLRKVDWLIRQRIGGYSADPVIWPFLQLCAYCPSLERSTIPSNRCSGVWTGSHSAPRSSHLLQHFPLVALASHVGVSRDEPGQLGQSRLIIPSVDQCREIRRSPARTAGLAARRPACARRSSRTRSGPNSGRRRSGLKEAGAALGDVGHRRRVVHGAVVAHAKRPAEISPQRAFTLDNYRHEFAFGLRCIPPMVMATSSQRPRLPIGITL